MEDTEPDHRKRSRDPQCREPLRIDGATLTKKSGDDDVDDSDEEEPEKDAPDPPHRAMHRRRKQSFVGLRCAHRKLPRQNGHSTQTSPVTIATPRRAQSSGMPSSS